MEVVKYRGSGTILIKPKNKSSLPLFKHCANGKIAVPTRDFNRDVAPILFLHKVGLISETDET